MRGIAVIIGGLLSLGLISSAYAYDKFIPLGAGYSTSVSVLPPLNSQSHSITSQTDIYESEMYQRDLDRRLIDSRMTHFTNDQNSNGTEGVFDY